VVDAALECRFRRLIDRSTIDFDMDRDLTRMEQYELTALLFLHGMALASWFVPMGAVLETAKLRWLIPFAFAASAMSALLSPLFFGAMADRSVPPIRVLRWLSVGSAVFALAVGWGIREQWSPWLIWIGIQLQSLLSIPTNSLTGSIVLGRLSHAHSQFGSIRAWGTIGWIAGCWLVSWLHVDNQPTAFLGSAGLWVVLAAFTLRIPMGATLPAAPSPLTLRERFGLDALALLINPSHRVIFLTAALVAIPFAAFYPYTPAHLADLGLERISAWMSLGQVLEVGVLFGIGAILTRWGFKRVIALGLFCGILRYALYAFDTPWAVLTGVALHGFAYAFTYISIQLYLAARIKVQWRSRAQALLSMMTGGIGNLVGYLLTGGWLAVCERDGAPAWTVYWLGLCSLVVLVMIYFVRSDPDRQQA
jgi:MFS family permease